MTLVEMQAIFEYFGAFRLYPGDPRPGQPHFILKSKLHSNGFIMCRDVLKYPLMCAIFAQEIFKVMVASLTHPVLANIGVVVSSAYSAIPLGWEVTRLLSQHYNSRTAYIEAQKDEHGNPTIIRGGIDPNMRVVVINELMTTIGGSTYETKGAVLTCNGSNPAPHVIEPVFVLVHRSKEYVLADSSAVQYVFHFDMEDFKSADCRYCQAGSVAIKPKI